MKLVYLSTCSSAERFVASGKSINSLVEAFKIARAKTVVATLFPVIGNNANMLTAQFYADFKGSVKPHKHQYLRHWVLWSLYLLEVMNHFFLIINNSYHY